VRELAQRDARPPRDRRRGVDGAVAACGSQRGADGGDERALAHHQPVSCPRPPQPSAGELDVRLARGMVDVPADALHEGHDGRA
jgi:hypothetical protein